MHIIAWRVSKKSRVWQALATPLTKRWLESLRMTNLCFELENLTYREVLKDLEEKRAKKEKAN